MIVSKDTSNTKMLAARKIFEEMNAATQSYQRKDVVEQFMSRAGLTPAVARTYYQKFLTELKKMAAAKADTNTAE